MLGKSLKTQGSGGKVNTRSERHRKEYRSIGKPLHQTQPETASVPEVHKWGFRSALLTWFFWSKTIGVVRLFPSISVICYLNVSDCIWQCSCVSLYGSENRMGEDWKLFAKEPRLAGKIHISSDWCVSGAGIYAGVSISAVCLLPCLGF